MTHFLKKLANFFTKAQPAHANSSLPHSGMYSSSMLGGRSDTAMRGQLVQVMMRDLVRKSGIPPGWVVCQIQVINSRSKGQGIYVRLIVKHWDERLMKYAFAFQKALLTDIVQFEPQATQWLQGISWQLEVASTCPVTDLPSSKFWKVTRPVDPFEIVPMPAPLKRPPLVSAMAPKPSVSAVPAAPVMPARPAMPVISVLPVMPGVATASAFALLPQPATESAALPPENDTARDLERLFAIRDKELEHSAVSNLLPAGYEKTEPSPL